MATTTISFRIEADKRDQIDRIAEAMHRDRSWILNEALNNYLEIYSWQTEHLLKAVRAAKAPGAVTYSQDEVKTHVEQMIADTKAGRKITKISNKRVTK